MTLLLLLLACHRTQSPPTGSTELDLVFAHADLKEVKTHPIPMPKPPPNLPMPTGAFRPWSSDQTTECHQAFEAAEAGLLRLPRIGVEDAMNLFEETEQLVMALKSCEMDAVLRVPSRVRAADLNRMAANWLAENLDAVDPGALVDDIAALSAASEAGYRAALTEADAESPWGSHARWALVELEALQ